jgi:hypothetical protein
VVDTAKPAMMFLWERLGRYKMSEHWMELDEANLLSLVATVRLLARFNGAGASRRVKGT